MTVNDGRTPPSVEKIMKLSEAWACRMCLIDSAAQLDRLRRARLHRIAELFFPHDQAVGVALFAQWAIWTYVVDDQLDRGGLWRNDRSVRAVFDGIVGVLHDQPPTSTARPVHTSLADLWQRSAATMSDAWRARFIQHMMTWLDNEAAQAASRRTGHLASVGEYLALRRGTIGMWAWDLVEVVRCTEISPEFASSQAWTELCAASADIIAWTNDIQSAPQEADSGETANLVLVLQHALGCDHRTAAAGIRVRISARRSDLRRATHAVNAEINTYDDADQRGSLVRLATTIRDMPAAYQRWLRETGRYLRE